MKLVTFRPTGSDASGSGVLSRKPRLGVVLESGRILDLAKADGQLSGQTMLDLIRDPSSGIDRAIPIMITTTAPTPRLMEQARARGVSMVLRKQFSPKVLWQRLRSCLAPAMLAQEENAARPDETRAAV